MLLKTLNLINYKNLEVIADPVVQFLFNDNKVVGFICQSGKEVRTKELILTTGTFLNGLIHIGEKQTPAGRFDEKPSTGLSEQLEKFKLQIGRLKTLWSYKTRGLEKNSGGGSETPFRPNMFLRQRK